MAIIYRCVLAGLKQLCSFNLLLHIDIQEIRIEHFHLHDKTDVHNFDNTKQSIYFHC